MIALDTNIAVAACVITHGASLWTLNPADFKDIPNLKLLPTEGVAPASYDKDMLDAAWKVK
jgi:hypothetical protein